MSEIIVSNDHLPKEVLIEGSEGQHTMQEHFSWTKISSATSEMRECSFTIRVNFLRVKLMYVNAVCYQVYFGTKNEPLVQSRLSLWQVFMGKMYSFFKRIHLLL